MSNAALTLVPEEAPTPADESSPKSGVRDTRGAFRGVRRRIKGHLYRDASKALQGIEYGHFSAEERNELLALVELHYKKPTMEKKAETKPDRQTIESIRLRIKSRYYKGITGVRKALGKCHLSEEAKEPLHRLAEQLYGVAPTQDSNRPKKAISSGGRRVQQSGAPEEFLVLFARFTKTNKDTLAFLRGAQAQGLTLDALVDLVASV